MTDESTRDAAQDRANIRFPPPLVFLGFLLLGPLIDRWLALPPWPMPWWIGAVIVVPGALLLAVGNGTLRGAGENPLPWTATGRVLETGLYAYTRNPMYLGMAITMLGIAVIIHSVMAILLVPVAMAVTSGTAIAREEAYLEAKFGEPYRAYLGRVRRWF